MSVTDVGSGVANAGNVTEPLTPGWDEVPDSVAFSATPRLATANTIFSDISEFQVPVNDSYPHRFILIRSNDGNHWDRNFAANLAWCESRVKAGRIFGFGVYYFYRPGVNGAAIVKQRVGKPDSRMVAMIDVESAGGQVAGNQSGQVNREFAELASWIGDKRQVIGYGNTGDLNGLWPSKPPGARLIVANYSFNPTYPGKFAHQFTDHANTSPFGASDLSSADGISEHELKVMFGFVPSGTPAPPAPPPAPVPGTLSGPAKAGTGYRWTADGSQSLQAFAARRNSMVVTLIAITRANLSATNLQAFNQYVVSGVTKPMNRGLVFYTRGA